MTYKVLIAGAGRMGLRHATGVLKVNGVSEVCLMDLSEDALANARKEFGSPEFAGKTSYLTIAEAEQSNRNDFQVAIIATTAANRKETVALCLKMGAKIFLIEKTLGQSMADVKDLVSYINQHATYAAVNLNMRQYNSFVKLRDDLQNLPQLQGNKVLSINTGTIGIGANGIHYLDLLFYIFRAERAEIVAAEVEDTLIPSGRGPQFKDFGGWCTLKLYGPGDEYLARVHFSFSSTSTALGNWDILAPNGRIIINEVLQKRLDHFRKADSTLPVNRYAGDYLPPVESNFEAPFLGDLTQQWMEGVVRGEKILPPIEESLKVHEVMFKWLAHSKNFTDIFPIT